jgi:putative flippase GtrA
MQLKSPDSPFVRFLIAGGVNTLFGLLVYSIAITLSFEVWQALLVGVLAGVVFNFLTTGGYVFRDLTPTRFLRFTVVYLLVYFVNLGLFIFLSRWLNSAIWIQTILTIPMAFGSYLLMSRFVFTARQ